MTVTVVPVQSAFVAEVGDVDLSQPLDPADLDVIKGTFWTYAVLVFPDQILTRDQHLDIAKNFGPLESKLKVYREVSRKGTPVEIEDLSNLDLDDEIRHAGDRVRQMQLGNRLWHTDSSFKRVPARASLLYAREVPPLGGHTQFADLRAAYNALPEAMKERLEGMIAEHAFRFSRAKIGFADLSAEENDDLPPVPQIMVRTHPESGRRTLYLASHMGRVLGLPKAESDALIDELVTHATQPQFVHTHRWRVHDLAMWDDRCTMHRGTEFDDVRWRRDVRRATVSDELNTCEREGIDIAAE